MAKKCLLSAGLGSKKCEYEVSGARVLYLANYYPPNTAVDPAAAVAGMIGYKFDANGVITDILLPPTENFFEIKGGMNTLSFTDVLTVGGSGNKFRTHTVNITIPSYDEDVVIQGDAVSLGKFVAVVVDKSGNVIVLGRQNGIEATSFNYNSGAAEGDAKGWETVLTGSAMEIAPLAKDTSVITPIAEITVIPPSEG